MTTIKWVFLVALAGHLLCGVCDCWLTYLPNGRFKFGYMKDNQKLSDVFEGMPLRSSILSMLLGCLAMCMMFFGYLALALWMRPISAIHGNLMLLAVGLIFTFGIAFFAAVISGLTPLPRWTCVFNTTLLMLALMPTRIGGSGNWAGAIMFLGLLFFV